MLTIERPDIASMSAVELTDHLGGKWQVGPPWRDDASGRLCPGGYGICLCPAHDDRSPSLSIRTRYDRVILKCFAGCDEAAVIDAAERFTGLDLEELRPAESRFDVRGCTLHMMQRDKGRSPQFLRSLGVEERPFGNKTCLWIPYRSGDGKLLTYMWRLNICDPDKHCWAPRTKHPHGPALYGLDRLAAFRATFGWTYVVEGCTDTWCLWAHGLPCVGLPNNFLSRRNAAYFDGFKRLLVIREPGTSGVGLFESLACCGPDITRRVVEIDLSPHKDPNDMELTAHAAFKRRFKLADKPSQAKGPI